MTLSTATSLGYGGGHLNTQLPKILTELQSQSTVLLAGAAANAAIALPGIETQDTIRSAIMFAAGVPSDITSTMSIIDRRASGTLTLSSFAVGDKVSVNGRVYTAVAALGFASNRLPGTFSVGATGTETAANLAQAISADDASNVVATSAAAVVTIVARLAGTAGNAFALSAAASNSHATASGATLAGGTATTGVKSTTATTGNTIQLTWYQKSRVVGQA